MDDENQQQETITLPRTSAPWFSRTLSVNEETSFEVYYGGKALQRRRMRRVSEISSLALAGDFSDE